MNSGNIHFFHLDFNQSLTLLAAIVGLFLISKRIKSTDKLIDIKIKSSYETAFLDAIKIFESENVDARMGALDSLQRISEEYVQYRDQVLQVCFRFIRNNSNFDREDLNISFVREDIKKILDIFRAQPIISKKRLFNLYSLEGSHLSCVDFKEMNLQNINFKKTNLQFSDLRRSNFNHCDFSESNLQNVHFAGTKLVGVNFMDSDLSLAKFFNNDLSGAMFSRSILIGTEFLSIEKENFPVSACTTEEGLQFFENCMIVHEGKLLANHEKFTQSLDGNPCQLEIAKDELEGDKMSLDPWEDENTFFNTKFPDYVKVIPLGNKDGFKLEILDLKQAQIEE